MATVTIYDPSNQVQVINGNPPVDQSALVAQLQSDLAEANESLATANADKAALQTKIDAAKAAAQADKDADNANVAGQGVLDALA